MDEEIGHFWKFSNILQVGHPDSWILFVELCAENPFGLCIWLWNILMLLHAIYNQSG